MNNPNAADNLKPFTKGDPRINRKGRPKSFDALRELAQQIAHEEAKSGGAPVVVGGHKATVAEMILRQWAASKNPQLQRAFIEVAFGKVPESHNINFGNMTDDELRKFIQATIGIGGGGGSGSEAARAGDSN